MQLSSTQKRKAFYALEIMKQRFDQGQSITGQEIANAIGQRWMQKTSADTVYSLVRWLHGNGNLPGLIAGKSGYQRAQNQKQLLDYQSRLAACRNGLSARVSLVERDLHGFNTTTIN